MHNLQIATSWKDKLQGTLKTTLEKSEIPSLKPGEILVEMLYVPMHGSFWLASHPNGLHPRLDEFMSDDGFVFGNGGVGRVVQSNGELRDGKVGDFVCIFGHVPCDNYDCYACNVLHRYTECDYNQGTIIGHGKHSYDGTYSKYVVLPKYSYDVCFRAEENPSPEQLKSFMFGFLFADVRNALTRHIDTLRSSRRIIIFGAGYSGLISTYIFNKSCPEAKIFVVDSSSDRLNKLKSLNEKDIKTFLLPANIVDQLNEKQQSVGFRHELKSTIQEIKKEMRQHFSGRGCDVLFDGSSGNSAPLWDNKYILSPTAHCIPFGFGSEYILLNKELIQLSGLTIMMSRGVGNIRNRKEVIELIKAGACEFVDQMLIEGSRKISGLEETMQLIDQMQNPPKDLHEIEHAYIEF